MHSGKIGKATESIISAADSPGLAAILGCWFIEITDRKAPVFFRCHVVSIIHLRPIDNIPNAPKSYAHAEYQLMVYALDPEGVMNVRPEPDNSRYWRVLKPLNVELQFHGIDDDGAKELVRSIAAMCADGDLPVEPNRVANSEEMWKGTIAAELKRIAGVVQKKEQVM